MQYALTELRTPHRKLQHGAENGEGASRGTTPSFGDCPPAPSDHYIRLALAHSNVGLEFGDVGLRERGADLAA
jgi:hypothetical protein